MNKKGDWDDQSWPGLILGILILIMGIFPLLNKFGVLEFNLPYTPTGMVLEIILAAGGIYLIVLSCFEDDFTKWTGIIMGLMVTILGILPLLGNFGINITIPFLTFLYNPYLYAFLGITLIVHSFLQ